MLAAGLPVLPAAVPAAPFLVGLAQGAFAAQDELDVRTSARYVVDPETHRVRVTVDLTAANAKPTVVRGGTVTRYFFDGVNLGIQPEAVRLRATQDGQAVKVKVVERDGYRLATLRFRERIYFQETAHVRLAFDLPAGAPRSKSDVRVGSAFATFVAWAFGDESTVRIELPSRYRVDRSGKALEPVAGTGDGVQAFTATTDDPIAWYVQLNATDDAALTNDRLTLADGEPVVIRAWPEDARWRSRVRSLLRNGVPDLARRIGLPWPVDGPLSVTEVHTPLLEGYAGFYDQASDEITISEDLDDLTIVHEASHAWFNKRLFSERWIGEGLADEYASRVLTALGRKAEGPGSVKRGDPAAFALEAWPPPAPIRDADQDAHERYGYDASWTAMRRIVALVGEDGMRRLFAAAAAGTSAYPGEGAGRADGPAQRLAPVPRSRRRGGGEGRGRCRGPAMGPGAAGRPAPPPEGGRARGLRDAGRGRRQLGPARRRPYRDGRLALRGGDRRDGRCDDRPRPTRRGGGARRGAGPGAAGRHRDPLPGRRDHQRPRRAGR